MKPTRTTQPLRRKLRRPSQAVSNATRGRTVGNYNPQDAGRAAAKSSVAPKRPVPSGALKAPGLAGKLRGQADAALAARPRTQQTTRGKRRLSFEEAYSRRTTDSSRQRVLELYGKTAPPADRSLAPGEAKLPKTSAPARPVPSGALGKRRRRGLGSKLRNV